jgi:hypothetical protein
LQGTTNNFFQSASDRSYLSIILALPAPDETKTTFVVN